MKRLLLAAALTVAASVAFAAPTTYKIDATHTDVIASWNHLGFSTPAAHFGQVDGAITYDPANVAASSVQVTLPLSGMESHVPAFNNHLRSPDLFDAEKYPTITFRSTSVASAGENRLAVTGDLTIKGVTRQVVLDVVLNKVGEHPMRKVPTIGFNATTTIKRSDYGISYAVPAVSDEVKISITTEALAPKPAG